MNIKLTNCILAYNVADLQDTEERTIELRKTGITALEEQYFDVDIAKNTACLFTTLNADGRTNPITVYYEDGTSEEVDNYMAAATDSVTDMTQIATAFVAAKRITQVSLAQNADYISFDIRIPEVKYNSDGHLMQISFSNNRTGFTFPIPCNLKQGKTYNVTNNTSIGMQASYAYDADGTQTQIFAYTAAGKTVSFTAASDFKKIAIRFSQTEINATIDEA